MTTKADIVERLLKGRTVTMQDSGKAFAAANIALCKYWGKRDEELNLPVTSSLSISLGELGSHTTVSLGTEKDRVSLNGKQLEADDPFTTRLSQYLDLFRPDARTRFRVETNNSIPTAAGLASSASGFAALVMALNDLFGWRLDSPALSILARMGSGSASRSIFRGFVEWHAGAEEDGMDSYAEELENTWPELRVGLLKLSDAKKPIGSRPAMNRTRETSALYDAWPIEVAEDLMTIKTAIRDHNFEQLGRAAESNALAMHATMAAAWPPILYWKPETVEAMHRIWALREEGLQLYFTMDAGPNVKLLFRESDQGDVLSHFPKAEVVDPFST